MTSRSPSLTRCVVTAVLGAVRPSAGTVLTLLEGLAAIRSGASERVLCADAAGLGAALVLEAASSARRRGAMVLAELRGIAHTPARADAAGEDLEPARAVRRALANGGMSAREIGRVAVHVAGPHARERATYAVARGLGRFADGVEVTLDDPAVATRCVAALMRGEVAGAVALSIDPASGNLALAFARPR